VVSCNEGEGVMFRFFDIVLSSVGILLLFPLMVFLFFLGLFDTGSPLFFHERVGRYNKPFSLVKFRTMNVNTRSVATHFVDPAAVTPLGFFLRRTKLDELPQLWNVLKGEMSLVGPRPCLFNQVDLIEARASLGVFSVRPGITGLAQIKGIDMSTPVLLAEIDAQMIRNLTVSAYFVFIMKTIFGAGRGDCIR